MTTAIYDRSVEVLALESRVADWANALTRDPAEARALVTETLALAQDPAHGPGSGQTVQSWLLRLLRQRFHSVERGRGFRRSRSAAVTELGDARKREVLAQAVADAVDAL